MWTVTSFTVVLFATCRALRTDELLMVGDYFSYKDIRHVCYLSCDHKKDELSLVKHLMARGNGMRVAVRSGRSWEGLELMRGWSGAAGVLLDGRCGSMDGLLSVFSKLMLFDATHSWLVLTAWNDTAVHIEDGNDTAGHIEDRNYTTGHIEDRNDTAGHIEDRNYTTGHIEDRNYTAGHIEDRNYTTGHIEDRNDTAGHIEDRNYTAGHIEDRNDTGGHIKDIDGSLELMMGYLEDHFQNLNLSVDADIVVSFRNGTHYTLVDVFNFGRIQGNRLEKRVLGAWCRDSGLHVARGGFKYYSRWDFHNLTLRAVSVILERPPVFRAGLLEDARFSPGVSAMTKVAAQLLKVLREHHNFRFNYTIVDRWVESPGKNSTLAVTNALFWRQQDLSATCLRIFPQWLDWVDPFLPPVTQLQTKCYYLIPDKGVGEYENRLLSPLSGGVWACAGAACVACWLLLAAAAGRERRPQPGLYAACSVVAAVCQQAYEDGVQMLEDTFASPSRRLTLLVFGVTSMLLYNYYTSSVVSWLLSAAPPTIATMDGLIRSNLELVFEDIGYTRSWLYNPGSYYYSGYVNPKEDELRDAKVTRAKRTVPLTLPAGEGLELVRTGAYAYHTEPYVASQVIARRYSERELCALGALQVMRPAHVYIMGQKRSPYKQFFDWSLLRLLERGHTAAVRARVRRGVPPCSGHVPRALALGQAAPAFALLAHMYCLAGAVLLLELLWHRLGAVKESGRARHQRERSPPAHRGR